MPGLRHGEEFHDLHDVRFLLRCLTASDPEPAVGIVLRYCEKEQIPSTTRLALEELLRATRPAPSAPPRGSR